MSGSIGEGGGGGDSGGPQDFLSTLMRLVDQAIGSRSMPATDEDLPWYAQADTYNNNDATVVELFKKVVSQEDRNKILAFKDRQGCTIFARLAAANLTGVMAFLCSPEGWGWGVMKKLPQDKPNILVRAIQAFSNEFALYLLNSGVDTFLPTALFNVKGDDDCIGYSDALRTSIQCCNTKLACELLPHYSINTLTDNCRYQAGGESVAIFAARRNNLEVVKAMIKHGVDFSTTVCGQGETACSWAAYSGATDVLLFLIRHYKININTPLGSKNRYLIQEAFGNGCQVTFAALCLFGADCTVRIKGEPLIMLILANENVATYMGLLLSAQPCLTFKRLSDLCGDNNIPHCTVAESLSQQDLSNDLRVRLCASTDVYDAVERTYRVYFPENSDGANPGRVTAAEAYTAGSCCSAPQPL